MSFHSGIVAYQASMSTVRNGKRRLGAVGRRAFACGADRVLEHLGDVGQLRLAVGVGRVECGSR